MLIRTRLASVLHVSSIDDVVEIFCNSELCDLERDSSSRILLDQSQRQINAGGPASRCPDPAVVNMNRIGFDGDVGVFGSQLRGPRPSE